MGRFSMKVGFTVAEVVRKSWETRMRPKAGGVVGWKVVAGRGRGELQSRSTSRRVQQLRNILHPEFRVFVEAAEKQLLLLFTSIDRDKDGRLNKKELQAAFQRAGLSVPNRRLAGFFDEIDLNHDGFITFDEWR